MAHLSFTSFLHSWAHLDLSLLVSDLSTLGASSSSRTVAQMDAALFAPGMTWVVSWSEGFFTKWWFQWHFWQRSVCFVGQILDLDSNMTIFQASLY